MFTPDTAYKLTNLYINGYTDELFYLYSIKKSDGTYSNMLMVSTDRILLTMYGSKICQEHKNPPNSVKTSIWLLAWCVYRPTPEPAWVAVRQGTGSVRSRGKEETRAGNPEEVEALSTAYCS